MCQGLFSVLELYDAVGRSSFSFPFVSSYLSHNNTNTAKAASLLLTVVLMAGGGGNGEVNSVHLALSAATGLSTRVLYLSLRAVPRP